MWSKEGVKPSRNEERKKAAGEDKRDEVRREPDGGLEEEDLAPP